MVDDDRVRETLVGQSDEQLLQMLTEPSDQYSPVALEVARAELDRRGGEESVRSRMADAASATAAAEQKVAAALAKGLCPKCESAEISKHSGWVAVVVAIGLTVGLWMLVSKAVYVGVIWVVAAAIMPLVTIYIVGTALFGRNKCKACGAKWR
jgi:hypothetical protein